MWARLNKLIKPNGAIVLFGSEPFSSALRMSNIKHYKYDWIWNKGGGSNFLHAPNMPIKSFENIVVFSNSAIGHKSLLGNKRMEYNPQGTTKGKRISRTSLEGSEHKFHRKSHTNGTTGYKNKRENYPKAIIEISNTSNKERGLHPTQKPVALMEYLILTYTNKSETVLDFTMGSGSTGVACKNTNRDFIGIELDQNYFNIAKNRIESTTSLFN